MKIYSTLLLLTGFLMAQSLHSQCNLNPTVTGDTLLCPDASGILTTQVYDSYQWFKREYSNGVPEAIPGATNQTLAVSPDDVLYYFSVEVTLDTCVETSPEVLVDGLVFILPFVEHTGEYTFDPDEEAFVVCEGDTMFLTLGAPYGASITWYQNGQPIPGASSPVYAVTAPGEYTVEAAPNICPDFILPLGLTLEVIVKDCSTATRPEPLGATMALFPNPASDWVQISLQGLSPAAILSVFDAVGRPMGSWPAGTEQLSLSISHFPAGMYSLKVMDEEKMLHGKLLVQH